MRKIVLASGSALFLLAGVATGYAADPGPVEQNSQAMKEADQVGAKPMNIRQQIESQLSKSGYTDVTVMPSSFFVKAKNKQGNLVEMVIGPETFTEVTEVAPKPMPASTTATPNATPPAPKT